LQCSVADAARNDAGISNLGRNGARDLFPALGIDGLGPAVAAEHVDGEGQFGRGSVGKIARAAY
jgi:hypothetical protein